MRRTQTPRNQGKASTIRVRLRSRGDFQNFVANLRPIFEGHFPGYPIMPGVLMIETIAQAGGWLVMAGLRFRQMAFLAKVSEAKMRSFLAPGQAIRVEATQDHDGSGYAVVSGRIKSAGKLISEATITYRVMNFPNPALRDGLFEVARRVGVPPELMRDG